METRRRVLEARGIDLTGFRPVLGASDDLVGIADRVARETLPRLLQRGSPYAVRRATELAALPPLVTREDVRAAARAVGGLWDDSYYRDSLGLAYAGTSGLRGAADVLKAAAPHYKRDIPAAPQIAAGGLLRLWESVANAEGQGSWDREKSVMQELYDHVAT